MIQANYKRYHVSFQLENGAKYLVHMYSTIEQRYHESEKLEESHEFNQIEKATSIQPTGRGHMNPTSQKSPNESYKLEEIILIQQVRRAHDSPTERQKTERRMTEHRMTQH
jgi:hypothetical protein